MPSSTPTVSSSPIKVMCVDDHRIVRDGIELIIGRHQDMRVVASVASGEEAVESFRIHRPDITLMDLQLGGMSGVETIRLIRREAPECHIVVLTMYQGDEDINRALRGAATYLPKDTLGRPHSRRTGSARGNAQNSTVHRGQAGGAGCRSHAHVPEIQVMELLSLGMRNKEIAASPVHQHGNRPGARQEHSRETERERQERRDHGGAPQRHHSPVVIARP